MNLAGTILDYLPILLELIPTNILWGIEVYGFTGSVNPRNKLRPKNYGNAIAGEGIPKYSKVGELISHDAIMALWDTNVSSDYLVCKRQLKLIP